MDDGHFTTLLTPHLLEALRVAVAMVGIGEAEDVVQEAALRAWRAWGDLRDVEALRAWFLRITVNACRTWRNQRNVMRQHEQSNANDNALAVLAMAGTGPGSSDHAAMLDLYQAIQALKDDLRTVVLLRYFVGLDATEIGAVLDLPSPTVRTRLRRALMHMRHSLTTLSSLTEEYPIHEP